MEKRRKQMLKFKLNLEKKTVRFIFGLSLNQKYYGTNENNRIES